jgi:uncharacterized protein YoxC
MPAAVGLAFALDCAPVRVGIGAIYRRKSSHVGSLLSSRYAQMISVFALVGDLFVQVAGARDTIITKQVLADRSTLEQITATASAIMTIALLALTIVAIPVAWRLRKTYQKVDHLLDRIHGDIAPIVANAHDISDNINFITTAFRTDVAKLNETINAANDRLQRAITASERRVNEFNALLSVVQEEAEGVFVSTASTVRGVRRGAATFQDQGGMDLASDELDVADSADDLDIQEEHDVYDSRTESPTDAGGSPAAPRIRPRARSSRRA